MSSSSIPWYTQLKINTGYDVEHDGLGWDKAKVRELLSDGSPILPKHVLWQVLNECYPYFQKNYWSEELDTRKQWLSFLDAMASEIMTSDKTLEAKDALVILLCFTIVTGEAVMPSFERNALLMFRGDPGDSPEQDIDPLWSDLIARLANWISEDGREIIASVARIGEMTGTWNNQNLGRLRATQISVGLINPKWTVSQLGTFVEEWLMPLRWDVLSTASPSVFPVSFSSPAGPLISTQWATNYLLGGAIPKTHESLSALAQRKYRFDAIIRTWKKTVWDIYDPQTWVWFTGIKKMHATPDEQDILTTTMLARHPKMLEVCKKYAPIVQGLAVTPYEQGELYVGFLREENSGKSQQGEVVEMPLLE